MGTLQRCSKSKTKFLMGCAVFIFLITVVSPAAEAQDKEQIQAQKEALERQKREQTQIIKEAEKERLRKEGEEKEKLTQIEAAYKRAQEAYLKAKAQEKIKRQEKEEIQAEKEALERQKKEQEQMIEKAEKERLKKEAEEKEKLTQIETAYKKAQEVYLEAETGDKEQIQIQKEAPLGKDQIFEYTIGDGDALYICVWKKVMKLEQGAPMTPRREGIKGDAPVLEYIIGEGDVLFVYVWQERELSQEVIVRPDGKISFPLAGDMLAAGLTFDQLKEELIRRLKEYIRYPMVSITLRKLRSRKVFALEKTLSEEVIVRPDGKISFPLAGDMPAAGLTFDQLKEELTQRLKDHIRYPIITVSLRRLGGQKIIILGEVRSQGIRLVTGKRTVLEAIALAGGFTDDAVPSSTILIRGGLQNPEARRLNLNRAIERADMSQNVALQPEDIIFVPKKFIANLNYAIDQIIGPIRKTASTIDVIQDID